MYIWQLLNNSLPAALNQKDGIGGVFHNGKFYAMGGWRMSDGTRFNSVSYSLDGVTWTDSVQTASWTPRHAMPVVSHNGRIYVLGGDQNSGGYQPDVHSWSGDEADSWVVETTSAPWGDRAGHIGFSYGGYLWVGFGQTITPFTSTTTFFTDLWRSEDGATWELYDGECPINYRGYISSQPALLDGDLYFIGGGCYSTTDFPTREYKNDVMVMRPDFSIGVVNHGKGSNLPKLMYHSIAAFYDKLWVFGGFNGADQRIVYSSSDKGKTWVQEPTPPWSARHAAMLIPAEDGIYFGTGQSATDFWKLYKLDETKIHFGATPDGTTNMNATYTVFDETASLSAGDVVTHLGFSGSRSRAMIPKIGKRTGTGTFDIVYSGSPVIHSGGGYNYFRIPEFTVPDDGFEYKIGFSFNYSGGADTFCFGGNGRYMKSGDVTGTNQVFSVSTDGSFAMAWVG